MVQILHKDEKPQLSLQLKLKCYFHQLETEGFRYCLKECVRHMVGGALRGRGH